MPSAAVEASSSTSATTTVTLASLRTGRRGLAHGAVTAVAAERNRGGRVHGFLGRQRPRPRRPAQVASDPEFGGSLPRAEISSVRHCGIIQRFG